MPWRDTSDPYRILVSEIMLQQTPVARVLPKYRRFLERWPDVESLAAASLREVLDAWRGLGYYRRGRALLDIARRVVDRYGGRIPRTETELKTFPSVGDATAAAVMSFAYSVPVLYLETNIRGVYIYFFFHDRVLVPDRRIKSIAEAALDRDDPRGWHYALMDYGAMLKRRVANPGRRSAGHARQRPYEGSDRQVRGRILARLIENGECRIDLLVRDLPFERSRIETCARRLAAEGLIAERSDRYRIAE